MSISFQGWATSKSGINKQSGVSERETLTLSAHFNAQVKAQFSAARDFFLVNGTYLVLLYSYAPGNA